MSLVDEWIAKAEGDYETAVVANRQRKKPLPDAVGFHCQQCAEKYLKGFLVMKGKTPAYTHDLEELLDACVLFDASLEVYRAALQKIDPYSVQTRYPGTNTTVAEAQSALNDLRVVRKVLRKKLGK